MQPRECASCGHKRPICTRGLCFTCRWRHRNDGTVTEFGYVKADRLADFALLRASHSVPVAASRLGVCERTGWRYEAECRMSTPVSSDQARDVTGGERKQRGRRGEPHDRHPMDR